MNSSNVVFHIIDTTEHTSTVGPFARHVGVMFRLVTIPVLFAGEAAARGLRTPRVAAEQMLAVSVEVFPEVAASTECGL